MTDNIAKKLSSVRLVSKELEGSLATASDRHEREMLLLRLHVVLVTLEKVNNKEFQLNDNSAAFRSKVEKLLDECWMAIHEVSKVAASTKMEDALVSLCRLEELIMAALS